MIDLSKLPVKYEFTTDDLAPTCIARLEAINMFGCGESKAEAEHDLWGCVDEYYAQLKKLEAHRLGVVARQDLDYLNKTLTNK